MPDDRSILRPGVWPGKFRVTRMQPGPGLAAFVEHFWSVEWSLDEPYQQRVLVTPSVHLVFTPGGSYLRGVHTAQFVRDLAGTGSVLGVRFRPGGFRPFLDRPVADLTDRCLAVTDVFDVDLPVVEREMFALDADPDRAAVAARVLAAARPAPDPVVDEVAGLVARIAGDPALRRVRELATAVGIGARTLQRLFHEYVGVGPKWVIRQYRLHDAAGRIAAGAVTDWARLAFELGYSDQAHLVREFTAAVGAPPARYADTGGRAREGADLGLRYTS